MNAESPGARAVQRLEIDDVFLVEAEAKVVRDFNPTQLMPEVVFAHQVRTDPNILVQTRTPLDGSDDVHIVRYIVHAELKLLKQGVGEKADYAEEDFLATMRFALAADYRCPKDALADRDAIGAFSRNAQFHVWPFMREEAHAMCGRLRIPRLTIPMMKPEAQPATTEVTGQK